jgi:L-fucose isomerase-like protein
MQTNRIAFVSLIRTTFDVALATAVTDQARSTLAQAGYTPAGPAAPVTTLDEARAAAADFAGQPPDLLILFQATFADSTMAMAFADVLDVPLLLWAVPEAHTGGRLRLNSLCGINLAGHAFTRAGVRYHHLYAAPDDPAALTTIQMLAEAAGVRRRLQTARLGRVGEHPAGFETCEVHSAALRETFGVEVVPVDLQQQVFAGMRAADAAAVAAVEADLRGRVQQLDTLDAAASRRTLSAYVTLRQMADAQQLQGFAVRCWPEFFTEMGCAACGAMSLLNDSLIPAGCEADVNGTLTGLLLQWLSGTPSFGSDIVSVDADADALVLWHCGLAPLAMADPATTPGVTLHSNRKMPLLLEFALKPGRVTVARLSEATGTYRLVIGSGEMVRGVKAFSGTTGLLRFDRPAQAVLETILGEGLEHHISLTYGDYVPHLRALAHMLRLPVLML